MAQHITFAAGSIPGPCCAPPNPLYRGHFGQCDAPTSSTAPPHGSAAGQHAGLILRSLRPLRRLAPFLCALPVAPPGLTVAFLLIAAISSLVIPLIAGRIVDKGFLERPPGPQP